VFAIVPAERAVTVITFVLEVAETPVRTTCRFELRLMAAVILVANCVALAAAFTDHQGKFVPEAAPSEPLARLAVVQPKLFNVSASAMLFPPVPAERAVTVTTAPAELAVTPAPTGQAAIAVARFVAIVVPLVLVAKVPLVVLAQVFVPLEPPVKAPHEKSAPRFDPPTAR
jgi:hypothetical protein